MTFNFDATPESRTTTSRIDRVASIGILPGVDLRVQQTRPVVVSTTG